MQFKPLSQLTQGSFLVRSTDFPANFNHSVLELANKMYVKVYPKTCLFSKSDLSTAIFQILPKVQSFINLSSDKAEIPYSAMKIESLIFVSEL